MMPRRLAKQCRDLLTGDGDDGDDGFTSTNVDQLFTLRLLRPVHAYTTLQLA